MERKKVLNVKHNSTTIINDMPTKRLVCVAAAVIYLIYKIWNFNVRMCVRVAHAKADKIVLLNEFITHSHVHCTCTFVHTHTL